MDNFAVLWLLGSIASGGICFFIADKKGLEGGWYFVFGLFFPYLGIPVIILLSPTHEKLESDALSTGRYIRCTVCAEIIKAQAKKCYHCNEQVTVAKQTFRTEENAANEDNAQVEVAALNALEIAGYKVIQDKDWDGQQIWKIKSTTGEKFKLKGVQSFLNFARERVGNSFMTVEDSD